VGELRGVGGWMGLRGLVAVGLGVGLFRHYEREGGHFQGVVAGSCCSLAV
jgi:hypothetical protein